MDIAGLISQATWILTGALLLVAGLLIVLIGSVEDSNKLTIFGIVFALVGSAGCWLYSRPSSTTS